MENTSTSNDADLAEGIVTDKQTSFDFQQRKHPDWLENYRLDRDKVVTNRLTQRQSINVPIMSETRQAWLAKVDEAPMIEFVPKNSKDNLEKRKAIIWNEIWLAYFEKWKLDEVDTMDKKVVFLQGRSFKKLYWANGDLQCKVVDPYDLYVDPKMNPLDIESAMYIIHGNIFVPLNEILANDNYSKEARDSLSKYLNTTEGLVTIEEGEQARQAQQARLETIGVSNFDDFGSSSVFVELNEVFKKVWDATAKKYVLRYIIMAANKTVLYNKPAMDAVGIDFFPYTTWSEDPDMNDIWNDGKADKVRPMNKVMNTWISQLIENRSYRNFTMFFYDSTNPKYKPSSFEPKPFGMYPLPGKPSETLQPVPIGTLTDSLQELGYFKGMIESSTNLTSSSKGLPDKNVDTLGELKIDLSISTQITSASAKFYRNSWVEFANKMYKMLEANKTGNYKLYKADKDGELHENIVSAASTRSKSGFKIKAKMKSDVASQNDATMKKLIFVKNLFPNNKTAQKMVKEQALGLLDWSVTDIEAIMKEEEAMFAQAMQPQQPQGQPQDAGGIPNQIEAQLQGQQDAVMQQ